MSTLGAIHVALASLAILSGAATLLVRPKGGRLHKRLGYTYVTSMVLTNATALGLYHLFGTFGPFHALAIISLISIGFGTMLAVKARYARKARDLARRERLISAHYRTIAYSYAGLIAAFASEIAVRVPAVRSTVGPDALFAAVVMGASITVMVVAAYLIRTRASGALQPFRAPSRP